MTNKNISTFIKIPTLTIAISLLVVASLFLASLFLNAHTASAQYGSGEYGADEYSTQQAVDDGTDPLLATVAGPAMETVQLPVTVLILATKVEVSYQTLANL
jgi:hypothetical protein